MTLFSIDGQEYEGELIAQTRTRHPLRWSEFRLYKTPDGWLVHRTGCSRVYHRADTTCRGASGRVPGSPATYRDLPDNAEPCWKCNPPDPDVLGEDEQIRFEAPRHTVDECATPADVVQTLTVFRQRGIDRDQGKWTTKVSEPVAELLEIARGRSPEFAELPRPAARIA
jgi:hypothetical protein